MGEDARPHAGHGSEPGPEAPETRAITLRATENGTPVTRRSRRRRRWLTVLGVFTVLLVTLAGTGYYLVQRTAAHYDSQIHRIADAIDEESQPTADAEAGDAMNIMLVGTDNQEGQDLDGNRWQVTSQRSDVIMIVHVPADRKDVQVVSIPRDSWVEVEGKGEAKINSAFNGGDVSRAVTTVENLTDVRIDHVVMVDFNGFADIVDALGGVTITVPETTTDDYQGTIEAGTYVMDGETARRYVRQRYALSGGDFDRIKRQQNLIRAIAKKLIAADTLTDLGTLQDTISAITTNLAMDDAFTLSELTELAWSLRSVRASDLQFMTVPVEGTGRSDDGQSIVVLDEEADAELFTALRKDTMQEWIAANDPDLLPETVS